MCGIIGITGKDIKKIDASKLSLMLASLGKRGPDDKGTLSFPLCTLGQTRLSIIDLSLGHQPMRDNKRDMAITFNGEIYNYRELKKDLEAKGYVFSTNSDTEVILKAYQEYGDECPKYLDGMFAFAIWDNEKEQLFLARDRFGKKPLYYAFDKNNNLLVASEIKALFESGHIKGELDYGALDNYLTLMYVPPWKSIYKNIHVIPPASKAIYKNGELHIEKYWSIPENPQKPTYEEAKTRIKELIQMAVKKRMVADVEVGSLLSGGVDSTLVTYLAQQFMDRPIKTFSVGYQGSASELPYAREASEKIGTDHYTLEIKANLIDELEKITEYMDEPHADSSNFPQHLISGLASSKVKVALSGDGADELFMGYGWYSKYGNIRKIVQLKNFFFSNQFKEHIKNISVFQKNERKKLWKNFGEVNDDIVDHAINTIKNGGIRKINFFDLTTYLPGQLLYKIDRTSMMHSLEIRSPFLDKDLAEYVYNIPTEYKMNGNQGKIILKDILAEIMPKEFVYRRKQGFGAPVKEWLKTEAMKKFVLHTLGNNASIYKFLKKEVALSMINAFYQKGDDKMYYKIWSLLCLELWLKSHEKYHRLTV